MKSDIKSRCEPTSSWKATLMVCLATLLALPVHAAVEVPNVPPGSRGVPPNILFILDDSGSMAPNGGQFMDMPDFRISGEGDVDRADGSRNVYDEDDDFEIDGGDDGDDRRDINFFSYTNNTLYYNPTISYRPWRRGDGTFMADTSYDEAWRDLNLASSEYDLGNRDRAFHAPKSDALGGPATVDQTQAVNYYRYQFKENDEGADRCEWTQNGDSWSWRSCVAVTSFSWIVRDDEGENTTVTRTLAQEKANFANWFSFHRTRMKAAKAGAGYAFSDLANLSGDDYRVGYDSIWNRSPFPVPVGNDNGLFRGANRETWFNRLYAAEGSGTTPLRTALQRAGDYFSDGSDDGPYGGNMDAENEQFQCRQNFSILTTDGFWNYDTTSNVGDSDNLQGALIKAPPLPNGNPGKTYQYAPVAPYMGPDSVTLADVAMKYWKTDLRDDMDNIVLTSPANLAFWQHMVTFGISIGLRGTLPFGSVRDVLEADNFDWPNPMDGPGLGDEHRIDDLLHAAVNGHGEFLAAADPEAFADGLKAALGAIGDRTGSASNVAASSTSISTDTRLFQARYRSGDWTGEITAYPVTENGILATSPIWNASENLPGWSSRDIYTTDSDGVARTFAGSNKASGLGTSGDGHSYADYIRGDASGEIANGGDLRTRASLLGDIIHSSPHYVRDTDTLYVGANDGMLHAFDGDNGREAFAYVPRGMQVEALKALGSPLYEHTYFVDGPVVVSDRALTQTATHPSGRNILVGTLGRGGKGVFGLDVTDPDSFGTDDILFDIAGDGDMGLVLGQPLIAKLNDGSVSVIFGNGINSTIGSAVLWIVNVDGGGAVSGTTKLYTGATGNNGLSAPRGWDSDGNGTVDLVYAGDQLGNLWKFDLSDSSSSKWGVAIGNKSNPEPLFIATDASGKRQPISGRPSIGVDPVNYQRWVFFGTGRLLNDDDLWNDDGSPNLDIHTMYGVIDGGGAIGSRYANQDQSDEDGLVKRSIEATGSIGGTPVRSFESAVDSLPVGKRGWFVDLLTPPNATAEGERIIGNAQVVGPVLITSSIIPSRDPCTPGGRGYINALNAFTGASVGEHFFDVDGDGAYSDDEVGDNPVGSIDVGVGMPTDGVLIDKLIGVGGSTGKTDSVGINNPAASGRVSWREVLRN